MKSIIRRCCVFALFVCLCLTGVRVYSNDLSSNEDYSLLTKGSEEDRNLLKRLNALLEKAKKDRDDVKNWTQDYVRQERKTYARVVNLFSKFSKAEQKQLAQDLKKGELSETFRERLDAQNLLINFQRLEAERVYLEKIQVLYNRLSSKILEAESAREIIVQRMISDVQKDKLQEKEEVVDELSKFLDETQQKLDVWKENGRQQKENLIDSIIKDSGTQGQKKNSQDERLAAKETPAQGWKKATDQRENFEEIPEEQDVEQTEDVKKSSEEQEVSVEERFEEQKNEQTENVEESFEEQKNEPKVDVEESSEEQKNEPKVDVEENSEEQKVNVEENSEEQETINKGKVEESQSESEEIDLLEQDFKADAALSIRYADEEDENSNGSQIDLIESDKTQKTSEPEDSTETSQSEPKALETSWTEVRQTENQGAVPKKIITGIDLQLASKPSALSTKEDANRRRTISIGNVEFAFRLCSENGEEFWIQETETTQAQWFVVGLGTTRQCSFKGAGLPVENVDWNACVAYIKRLNALNVAPEGWIFTLPTDAQWESAWNAGKSGDASPDEYAWFSENSDKKTHEVGTKKSDALGLYDMTGNVWEWTRSTDSTGRALIVRGASWNNQPQDGVLNDRFVCAPKTCGNNLGLRLVLIRKKEVAASNSSKILR